MLQLQKNKGNAIIIGIIITVVAIMLTVLAIYFTLKNSKVEEAENVNEVEENIQNTNHETVLSGTLFTDMYKHNGVSLKEDDLGYYVITGLKNKTVENAINQKISQQINQIKQEAIIEDEDEDITVTLTGNYADVISIKIAGYTFQGDVHHIIKTVNCSLITGEEIEFENLFTSEAASAEVYKDKLYTRLMWAIYGTKDGPELDMQERDYGKLEDLTQEMASDYDNGKKLKFYFSENTIYVCENNELREESTSGWDYITLEINMPEYADKIAIYKRFVSEENLYETKVEREEPVFCVLQKHDVFEKISDNVYLAVYGPEVYENKEVVDKILENEKAIIKEEASQFARIIGSNEYAIYAVNLDMNHSGNQVIVYRSATYIDATYFQSRELSIGITQMWDSNIEYRGYEIPDEKIIKRDLKVMDKRYDSNGIQISQQDYEIDMVDGRYVYIKKNADGTIEGRYKMVWGQEETIEFEPV